MGRRSNPGSIEDEHVPDEVIKVHHGKCSMLQSRPFIVNLNADPVSSATSHPRGAVLATCSGRRVFETNSRPVLEECDSSSDKGEIVPLDNSLKIWTL